MAGIKDTGRGFPCPDCGGRALVEDTRLGRYQGGTEYRWRRRECRRCGRRFTTYETTEKPERRQG
jgi:transcriptional regulator NrdR family protein